MPATKRSHRSQLSIKLAKKQAKNLTTGRFMSDEQRRKFEEEEEEEEEKNQLINQAILQAVEERVILDVSNASTNSSSNLAPCTSSCKATCNKGRLTHRHLSFSLINLDHCVECTDEVWRPLRDYWDDSEIQLNDEELENGDFASEVQLNEAVKILSNDKWRPVGFNTNVKGAGRLRLRLRFG